MTNGFFTAEQIRMRSQCWRSPWRAVAREPREQFVTRVLNGVELQVPIVVDRPMPTKFIRLRPNEMQAAAIGGTVRVGGLHS